MASLLLVLIIAKTSTSRKVGYCAPDEAVIETPTSAGSQGYPHQVPAESPTPVDTRHIIRCSVAPNEQIIGAGRVEMVVPPEDLEEGTVSATAEDDFKVLEGDVFFSSNYPMGQGWLRSPGFQAVRFSWNIEQQGSACSPLSFVPVAAVTGRVVPFEGETYVHGCGGFDKPDEHGNFYIEADSSNCTLQACRRDGVVTTCGASVTVTPEAGEEEETILYLPATRGGGVGLRWRAVASGWLVVGAFKDSPAIEAGLLPGDIVVSVDEVSTVGLSLDNLLSLTEGPERTYTLLDVASDTRYRGVYVERRYLNDPWVFKYSCLPGRDGICETWFEIAEGEELDLGEYQGATYNEDVNIEDTEGE